MNTQEQCSKRKYTRNGALFALATAQDLHNDYRPVRAYKCECCSFYHLTSKHYYDFKTEKVDIVKVI